MLKSTHYKPFLTEAIMSTRTIDYDKIGTPFYVTDSNLFDLTALKWTLLCDPREVPFDRLGVPAQQTIIEQVYPDFFVSEVVEAFRHKFISLAVERLAGEIGYKINVTLNNGVDLVEFARMLS
jgi:hypothetical protein